MLDLGVTQLPLGEITYVMGVINVSPDSKNVHTIARSVDEALLMADRYRSWGATMIDVGGQSSHFDNPTIEATDEIARVVPIIEALVAEGHLVAIDTWKPDVAGAAVGAGAVIINDTGGLADPEMRQTVAEAGVAAVAVYVEGDNPHDVGRIEIREDKADRTADVFALSSLISLGWGSTTSSSTRGSPSTIAATMRHIPGCNFRSSQTPSRFALWASRC